MLNPGAHPVGAFGKRRVHISRRPPLFQCNVALKTADEVGLVRIPMRIDEGAPRFDVDQNLPGGVFGRVLRRSDNRGDGLADRMDLASCEDRIVRNFGDLQRAADREVSEMCHVSAGVSGNHARRRGRADQVARRHAAAGMGASNQHEVRGTGQGDIIDVASLPRDQPFVLDAPQRGADRGT